MKTIHSYWHEPPSRLVMAIIACLVIGMICIYRASHEQQAVITISEGKQPLSLNLFADIVDAGWEKASVSQRARIVDYAWQHFLADSTHYDIEQRASLWRIIERSGPSLTRGQARQVQQQFIAAYVVDESALGTLTFDDLEGLRTALMAVRTAQPLLAELTTQWLLVKNDGSPMDLTICMMYRFDEAADSQSDSVERLIDAMQENFSAPRGSR